MYPKDLTFNLESVKYLRQGSLLKVKHPQLEHTTLTENCIAAAIAPHAGSAMTCHLSDHKSSPSVKVMDRPTEAVEVAAKAVDEEDVEDVVVEEGGRYQKEKRKLEELQVENESLSRKLAALQSTAGGTTTPGNAMTIVATVASAITNAGDVFVCRDSMQRRPGSNY